MSICRATNQRRKPLSRVHVARVGSKVLIVLAVMFSPLADVEMGWHRARISMDLCTATLLAQPEANR